MPYCTRCGNQVTDADLYCGKCGAQQKTATPGATPQPARPRAASRDGISPKAASILCYIPFAGWVAAIVVLASERFRNNKTVRFHAFQGLYLFVGWLIVDWVVGPFFRAFPGFHIHVEKLLEMALLGIWIFMMVKTSQEQTYSLPIIGELAERSITER